MVALLAVLAPVAAGAPHGAAGAPAPSESGGVEYGATVPPLRPVRLPARPVATRFALAPRTVVAPALPAVVVRVEQRGSRSVRAHVAMVPRAKGAPRVRIDLGRVRVGRSLRVAWPAGTALAPGRYVVRLEVRGLGGTGLARSARAPGRARLTVRAPGQPPPPPAAVVAPAAFGHAFPVAGPHTYGEGFGAPRNGYSHQGQDVLAPEGTPVVAPSAGTILSVDNQPSAAGYYVVEHAGDGYDYFFAHCQAASTGVSPGQAVAPGQPLCRVGHTGDATGPHLHFEAWVGGWRVNAGSHPIDPLPLLKSWDTAVASR
jgi:murein DD-endopeptidase MepM/ murein hydrolase activator NlpD